MSLPRSSVTYRLHIKGQLVQAQIAAGIYRGRWRRFLAERGYVPVAPATFAKDLATPSQPSSENAPYRR